MSEEVEAFLEHFGVRGMHWGVRKNPQKALNRLNANSVMLGTGLRGYGALKIADKRRKKGLGWDIKYYEKLSPSEKAKYDRKISRRAYSEVIGRGIAETLLVSGAGLVAINKSHLDPKSKDVLKTGAAAFAGISGLMRGVQVRAIHDANKADRLRAQIQQGGSSGRRN